MTFEQWLNRPVRRAQVRGTRIINAARERGEYPADPLNAYRWLKRPFEAPHLPRSTPEEIAAHVAVARYYRTLAAHVIWKYRRTVKLAGVLS